MQIRTEAEFKGHLTKEQELRRRHFVELAWNLPLFFPRRSFIDPGILERVNRYAGQGGGVVFAITHFSARDVLDFALIASRFDILNARRADTPIALHQAARREIKMFGYQISANFWPVFIEDTVQALKAGKYHWPDGKAPETREIVALNEAYINGVREGVSIGGSTVIANKPGRRPQLELTSDKPLQRILMTRNEQGQWVDDSTAMLVVVGLSFVNDRTGPTEEELALSEEERRARYRAFYQARKGLNVFTPVALKVNFAMTPPERRALCEKTGLSIDHLVTALLATQVDYRYNAIPAEVTNKAVEAYRQLEALSAPKETRPA